jgi:Secretion system C-terminal sorting domain
LSKIFKMHRLLFFIITLVFFQISFGQTGSKSIKIKGQKTYTFDPTHIPEGFYPQLINLEAPKPNGDSYQSFLLRQKQKTRSLYPIREGQRQTHAGGGADPLVTWGNGTYKTLVNGIKLVLPGGLPNDNSMAISNDGIMVLGVNSYIYAHDVTKDSAVFKDFVIYLASFAGGGNNNYYDPKLIYDPKADRFILIFLKNSMPESSRIFMAFSTTNDPRDPWNVYSLPGNPLNNNRWTDYPAISISEDELFITANLIIPNVSWQVGFDGSIIWQVNKQQGFAGDTAIQSKLHYDIRYNGKYTRNIHPVRGAYGINPANYFLSNRNFDLSNDTIFVMELEGTLQDADQTLTVRMGKSKTPYGMPPNGRQQDHDPGDSTSGLQTNDARVLGAFVKNNEIQFVGNTVNPNTGLAAVYHGFIAFPDTTPFIRGTIIGDSKLDLGYPNIAFAGNEPCDVESMIGFDFTSPTDFAGVGVLYYDNDGTYSKLLRMKNGENYVDRLGGTPYERWGDYFGIQRKFDEPGVVFSTGFYGTKLKKNSTWMNRIESPDTTMMVLNTQFEPGDKDCNGTATVTPIGGMAPYSFIWSNDAGNGINQNAKICKNDSVFVTVMDRRGCTLLDTIFWDAPRVIDQPVVMPNPFDDRVTVLFNLQNGGAIHAELFDMKGSKVGEIIEANANAGLNELSFTTMSLPKGNYIIRIRQGENLVFTDKVTKQ